MTKCYYDTVDALQYEVKDYLDKQRIKYDVGYPDRFHGVRFTIYAEKEDVVKLLKEGGFGVVDFHGVDMVRDPWVLTPTDVIDRLCEIRADIRMHLLSAQVVDDKLTLPSKEVIDKEVDAITNLINGILHSFLEVQTAAYNDGYKAGYTDGTNHFSKKETDS